MIEKDCTSCSSPPMSAPNAIPDYPFPRYEITAQELEKHLFLNIYIWTKSKESFWMYPVEIDDTYIKGYIWRGNQWIYIEFEWRQIDCYYS